MASDELKEMRKNLTKEAVRDHQMATTGGTQTDLFTCGKCKGKSCTYTQVKIATCARIVAAVEAFMDVVVDGEKVLSRNYMYFEKLFAQLVGWIL